MLLMLSEKGKYASATENRRFVWAEIVWPLILEINDVAFSLKQYQITYLFLLLFHQMHFYK